MGKVLLSCSTVAMLSCCSILWVDAAGKAFTALSFGLFEMSLFLPRQTIVLSMGFPRKHHPSAALNATVSVASP
jgi:hypothetical protein